MSLTYKYMDKITSNLSENNETVVPQVVVGTGNPDMPNGRYETPAFIGSKGNQPLPDTELAVGPQYADVKASNEFLRDSSKNGDKQNTI